MPPESPKTPGSGILSSDTIRTLTAMDLGIAVEQDSASEEDEETEHEEPPSETPELLDDTLEGVDDLQILNEVEELLKGEFAGVIFTGPPGTSKTYYAHRIAARLADRVSKRVRTIQFHPSYQYEDFVEGLAPKEDGTGFHFIPKHLLQMCEVARNQANGETCVIVIDELSRSDPGRVFGEALTYIEKSKRNTSFSLASGRVMSIPDNLVFLATMNEMDKGVDDVDMALERRFAKMPMEPSPALLKVVLDGQKMEAGLQGRVLLFFNKLKNSQAKLGHAYFHGVKDEEGLRRLWKYQLKFAIKKAYPLNPSEVERLEGEWKKIFPAAAPSSPEANPGAGGEGD